MIDNNPDYPLQKLVFAYAKAKERVPFEVIFGLDSQCAKVAASTREMLIGQMRLAWWRDVIAKDPANRPKGHPYISLLNQLPGNDQPGYLDDLVNCWEAFLVSDRSVADIDELVTSRAKAFCNFLSGYAHIGDMEMLSMTLKTYAQWQILRRTALIEDEVKRNMLLQDSREKILELMSKRLRNIPKPVKIFAKLINNDLALKNINKPLLRPSTALRIIYYGLT
jgi:phytoene synthase